MVSTNLSNFNLVLLLYLNLIYLQVRNQIDLGKQFEEEREKPAKIVVQPVYDNAKCQACDFLYAPWFCFLSHGLFCYMKNIFLYYLAHPSYVKNVNILASTSGFYLIWTQVCEKNDMHTFIVLQVPCYRYNSEWKKCNLYIFQW